MTDNRNIVQQLRDSEPKALETLFRTTRRRLLSYVCSLGPDAASAHDVVQDVFADLWERRTTLDETKPVEALLFRMCRNRALAGRRNEATRRGKRAEIRQRSNTHVDEHASTAIDEETLDNMMSDWLQTLPDRQREALVLSRLQDLSHREVATVMGVSTRTVNNHIVRALATLRERVRSFEPSLFDE